MGMLATLLAACTGNNGDEPLGGDPLNSGPRVEYVVDFEGELPDGLESYLRSVSNAVSLEAQPPSSVLILRRRADADLPRLKQGLRAQGYYEGDVTFDVRKLKSEKDQSDESEETLLRALVSGADYVIAYKVDAGPPFLFNKRTINIDAKAGAPTFVPPEMGALGLKQDEPANSDQILEAETKLLRDAQQDGFAFAKLGDRDLVVDYDTKTMDVELSIEPGNIYDFAEPVIEGYSSLNPDYARGRILYGKGQRYDIRLVEEGRQRLVDTRLFATVRIQQGDKPNADGQVPVTYEVTERKQRTVGLGAGYLSEDGPNARIFAEDRNLLGGGETLRGEVLLSDPLRQFQTRFRKPDVFVPDLDYLLQGTLRVENTDAFDSRSIGTATDFEYDISEKLIVAAGVAYRFARVEEDNDTDEIGLLSFPVRVEVDQSNSQLDPTEGWRVFLQGAPFFDTLDEGSQFNRIQLTHTRYYTLQNTPRTVLALRGSTGTIFGADRDEVPADERFYSGGGGSVRGIGFQLAGPLDADDDPIGGRSLLELSAELRVEVIENLEVAVFHDSGTVFRSSVPDFDNDLESGVGAGIRYLSAVGPIRFDIAVPTDRRKGIDDRYQFYISIGQAF